MESDRDMDYNNGSWEGEGFVEDLEVWTCARVREGDETWNNVGRFEENSDRGEESGLKDTLLKDDSELCIWRRVQWWEPNLELIPVAEQ